MSKKVEEKFSDREKSDRELAKELDLMFLEKMIQSLPAKKRSKKIVAVSSRSFSMRDMLDEIRQETAYGDMFREMLKRIRLAKLMAK
jgi:hypothetical protein